MDGLTEQEIADKVGYKTASTVHKRIAKIAGAYEDYDSGVSEVFGQVNRRRNGSSYRNGSCCRFCGKGDSMSREPFEAMPDVMDVKQLAEALQISKAGAYNLLSSPDFPTLRIGGRKLVMKNELVEWLKSRTNKTS